jgi:hypothetical protein
MVLEQYLPEWVTGYLSPIVLLLGGIVALLIVATYLKDKDSMKYKVMVGVGAVLGVLIVILAVIEGYPVRNHTLILIALAAFTLIIRPFRDINIAVIIGLLVMVLVYIMLGNLAGQTAGSIDLTVIAQGWPRIIIAFIAGGFVFGMLRFAEELMHLFGKILNFWPVMLILGVICIAEACCIFLGYGSIFDYINQIKWSEIVPKTGGLLF